jgi:hypothetical protein
MTRSALRHEPLTEHLGQSGVSHTLVGERQPPRFAR